MSNTLIKTTATLSAIIFSSSFMACSNAKNEPLSLNYNIERVDSGVKITLKMRGETDGETVLKAGDVWADEKSPHDRFRNIEVLGGSLSQNSAELKVQHDANAELTISWELHRVDGRNFEQDPTYFFAPVIKDEYIHLIGYTSLITPVTEEQVSINFKTSTEMAETVLSPLWSDKAPKSAEQIPSGFLITGKIELARSDDGRIAVGITPGLEVNAAKMIDEIEPVLSSLSDVWGSEPTSYTVTLLPVDAQIGSVLAGTAFSGGFAAAASADMGENRLGGFLSHEAAHEWVPSKLGAPEFEATGREPEGYWISEGFTQLLSRKAQLKSGQLNKASYVERVNEDLRELYLLPVRTYTNVQVGEMFWSDRDVERLPYLRGFLVAAKWDAEISKKSNYTADMIDVLKSLESANQEADDGIKLTSEIVMQYAKTQGALSPKSDVSKFIIEGELFTPPSDMLGHNYVLSNVEVRPYDVGFDPEKTLSSKRVEGVSVGGNAYRAGLRNGMRFVSKISGGGGDTSIPLVLKVSDKEQEFEVSYIPIGTKTIMVPQFAEVK